MIGVDYPGGANNLPAMQYHDFTNIINYSTSANDVGVQYLKGGMFPCGLIRIDWNSTGDPEGNLFIQIDMVPGNHRGYLCEDMKDM